MRSFVHCSAFLLILACGTQMSSCGNAPMAYTASQKPNPTGPKAPVSGVETVEVLAPPTAPEFADSIGGAVETFSLTAAPPPPSDFVFVVDSSGSMERVISAFVNGFESIPPSSYPTDSRMAVMNMIAHEIDNPEMPIAANAQLQFLKSLVGNSSIILNNVQNFMNAEPGYLRFLTASSVANYKSAALANGLSSLISSKFNSYPLCNSEWFLPGEMNSTKNKSCLGAAMQISGMVGIESGLMSVLQLMKKNSQPIFRKNAGVHVVFISDTHDPGNSSFTGYQEYVRQLPSFNGLENAIRANSKDISFVKLHGVVPFTQCKNSEHNLTNEGIFGGSYLAPIKASGGVAVDMCQDNVNYESVVNQLFDEARKVAPFQLKADNVSNVSVKVNGKNHPNFKVLDGRSVEVGGLVTSQDYSIQVSYSFAK